MNKLTGIVSLFSLVVGTSAFAAAERYNVQCWAEKLRQTHGDSKDNSVNGHFVLELNVDETGGTVDYVGHVAITRNWDEKNKKLVDYYGIFQAKEKATSLSPRAKVYKDANYYRLREVNANHTSDHDGGGMWGDSLVVSKKLTTAKEGEKFDAHYVFRAGDHMGDTVDFTCSKDW